MEKIILTVSELDEGVRLDSFLADKTELSRSRAAGECEEGLVLLGDKPLEKKYKVKAGEEITVYIKEPVEIEAAPEDIPLDIVYEDSGVIVVNKPQGMVVHPAAGNERGTLVNGILFHCMGELSGINGKIRPGIVHRIDKDTSGLLVIAKTNEAHIALTEQWQSTKPYRRYIALVHGNIKEDTLTVDKPIGRCPSNRKKMAVVPGGRSAVTHVRVLERFGKYTLIECVLDTGRTHQIRVHMAYIARPIVGDRLYGVKKEEFNLNGQLLHAQSLGFINPSTKEQMLFTSDLPDYFEHVLRCLRNGKGNRNWNGK